MKVYRLMEGAELDHFLNKRQNCFGAYFYSGEGWYNFFRYKPNKKYVHFYLKKASLKHIERVYKPFHIANKNKSFYECVFEVPFKVLLHGMGCGYYFEDRIHWAVEFAVEAQKIKPEYLVDFKLVKPKGEVERDGMER